MFNKKSILFTTFSLMNEFGSVSRYSKNKPLNEESNIEHTGWVCLFCYFIASDIKGKLNINLDFEQILRGAICHDLDETLTGDIPRPTKYFNEEINDAVKKIEKQSIVKLTTVLNQYKNEDISNLEDDWIHAKGVNYSEQFIVKMADLISVVYKVWHEMILLNNFGFLVVAQEIKPIIEKSLETNYGHINPGLQVYFKEILEDCNEILKQCIKVVKDRSIVMPNFIPFP